MSKRGHWQGFLTAEDGSVLRVIGGRPNASRFANAVDVSHKARNAITRRRERDEQRDEVQAVRDAYGVGVR